MHREVWDRDYGARVGNGMETPCGIGVYMFDAEVKGQTVYFNVLRLKKSFMVWVGHEANMQGLSMAVNMPRVSTVVMLFTDPLSLSEGD